jgi:hypothetical protein
MAAGKTHVVSVRVEPHIKAALQAAADKELRSLANMVEIMVLNYCKVNHINVQEFVPSADTLEKSSK